MARFPDQSGNVAAPVLGGGGNTAMLAQSAMAQRAAASSALEQSRQMAAQQQSLAIQQEIERDRIAAQSADAAAQRELVERMDQGHTAVQNRLADIQRDVQLGKADMDKLATAQAEENKSARQVQAAFIGLTNFHNSMKEDMEAAAAGVAGEYALKLRKNLDATKDKVNRALETAGSISVFGTQTSSMSQEQVTEFQRQYKAAHDDAQKVWNTMSNEDKLSELRRLADAGYKHVEKTLRDSRDIPRWLRGADAIKRWREETAPVYVVTEASKWAYADAVGREAQGKWMAEQGLKGGAEQPRPSLAQGYDRMKATNPNMSREDALFKTLEESNPAVTQTVAGNVVRVALQAKGNRREFDLTVPKVSSSDILMAHEILRQMALQSRGTETAQVALAAARMMEDAPVHGTNIIRLRQLAAGYDVLDASARLGAAIKEEVEKTALPQRNQVRKLLSALHLAVAIPDKPRRDTMIAGLLTQVGELTNKDFDKSDLTKVTKEVAEKNHTSWMEGYRLMEEGVGP